MGKEAEAADISGFPGQADRVRTAREDDADGQSLQAGPGAEGQAPEGAGRPGKVSPRVQGGNEVSTPCLGRARHEPSRADDAEGPNKPAAKNRHPRMRALIRRYDGRVQEG